MEKTYGQFLKKKDDTAVAAQATLSWLDVPHDYKLVLHKEVPDPSLATAAFLLPFDMGTGDLMMALGANDQWNFVGGHIERGETLEEAVSREVFEEIGMSPLYMGYLGYVEINLHGEVPPNAWRYPFPTSYLSFYWGMVSDEKGFSPMNKAEIKQVKLFIEEKAMHIANVKDIQLFYAEALKRSKLFLEALNNSA